MDKPAKIILKTLLIIVACVVGILVFMCAFMSIGAHAKYGEFYSLRTKVAKNPGLWDDYVPQGITYNDDEQYYATCGYMKDNSDSRIYTVQKDTNKIKFYKLTSDGKPYTGHTGGLQYSNGKFYLASEQEGVFEFSANFDKTAPTIEIGKNISLNNNSSFVFADEDFVYIGEFAHVPKYPCVHEVTYDGVKHTAIMSKYRHGDFQNPVAIYSIPDEVQGVAVTENGSIIFSASWALNPSRYEVYTKECIIDTQTQYNGVPLYFVGTPSKIVFAPSFSEDVDIVGDKLISMTEAAGNKYYVGKFIFDFSIYSFNISDLERK